MKVRPRDWRTSSSVTILTWRNRVLHFCMNAGFVYLSKLFRVCKPPPPGATATDPLIDVPPGWPIEICFEAELGPKVAAP